MIVDEDGSGVPTKVIVFFERVKVSKSTTCPGSTSSSSTTNPKNEQSTNDVIGE